MSADLKTKSVLELQARLASLTKKVGPARSKAAHREDELQRAVHELHVHQVELEMQNRELRKA